MDVWYAGLEPYTERYTELLTGWVRAAWGPRGHLVCIPGDQRPVAPIRTGVVLDAYRRGQWATAQTYQLLTRLEEATHWPDVIYLDDLFHPGFAALPYVFALQPHRRPPRLYVRNWAQSVDEYDFTHPMRAWMRPYEQMVAAACTGVFVASSVQADAWHIAALPGTVHVVGLPFDVADVRARCPDALYAVPYLVRPRRVLYSSRWDAEKQPHFFMDLATVLHQADPTIECAVATGSPALRSTDPTAVERAHALAAQGVLTLYPGLDRAAYYRLVATSRVHFNCALQDYVSFTLLEASALGTPTVAPAWRSFPEVFGQTAPDHLYAAFQLPEALRLVRSWLDTAPAACHISSPAHHHHDTLGRTFDQLERDRGPRQE